MPMYEYKCKDCDHAFEKLLKRMTDTQTVPCPKCQGAKTVRAFSMFAVGAETGGRSPSPAPVGCGRCQEPGGCGMN